LTGGLPGVKGTDGTILISMLAFSVPPLPEVTLASNVATESTNALTTWRQAGIFPVGLEPVDQKIRKSEDKKVGAVCK